MRKAPVAEGRDNGIFFVGSILRKHEVIIFSLQNIIWSFLNRRAALRFRQEALPTVIGQNSARNPCRLVMNASLRMV